MNRYRSYMDRIRLDEETQKRILEQASAAAEGGAADEKKVVWFRRKWVKIGTGVAAAAACAVILITVLPAGGFKDTRKPAAQEALKQPDSGVDRQGGTLPGSKASRTEDVNARPAAENPDHAEADLPVLTETLYLQMSGQTIAVDDSIGDKVIFSLLEGETAVPAPEASPSAGSPSSTAAAPEISRIPNTIRPSTSTSARPRIPSFFIFCLLCS